MEFAPAARRAPSGTRGDEGHAPQGCRKTLRAPQITLATAQSMRYNNRASNRSPIQVSIVSGYSEVDIAPGLGAGGPGFESLHSDHKKQSILLENSLFLQLFHHIRSALSFSIPHLNQFHLMPFSVLFVYNHARFFALSTTLIIFYQI